MPKNPISALTRTTVFNITLTFSVTPLGPWTAGQTVTLRAQSLQDSNPRAGVPIQFFIQDVETGKFEVREVTTDSNGVASLQYRIPWQIDTAILPCGQVKFWAYDVKADTTSNIIGGRVAYPTRISIQAPSEAIVGKPFTIQGKLEYQTDPATWSPLEARIVRIFRDDTHIQDVTTGIGGIYALETKIDVTGTFTLKAVFEGEGWTPGLAPSVGMATTSTMQPLLSLVKWLAPIISGTSIIALSIKR